MNKKWIVLLVAISLSCICMACGKEESVHNEITPTPHIENKKKELDDDVPEVLKQYYEGIIPAKKVVREPSGVDETNDTIIKLKDIGEDIQLKDISEIDIETETMTVSSLFSEYEITPDFKSDDALSYYQRTESIIDNYNPELQVDGHKESFDDMIILVKNTVTGDVNKCCISNEKIDSFDVKYWVNNDIVVFIEEDYLEQKDYMYVLDMSQGEYQKIEIKQQLLNEYQFNYETIYDISFVDNETILFEYKNYIIKYNINDNKVECCIDTSENDIIYSNWSWSDGICTFIREKYDGDKCLESELCAIDFDSMKVVASVEFEKGKDTYERICYHDGIFYMIDESGFYAYDVKEKQFDMLYDELDNMSGYTDEYVYDYNYKEFGEYESQSELDEGAYYIVCDFSFVDDRVYLYRKIRSWCNYDEVMVTKVTLKSK